MSLWLEYAQGQGVGACPTLPLTACNSVCCVVCLLVCLLDCVCQPAEMASSKHQQEQLQREVKQLQALAAEKDGRLADAAAEQQRLRQQLDQMAEQLHQAGVDGCGDLTRFGIA